MSLHVVHIISGLDHGGAETVLYRLLTAPGQSLRHTVISMGGDGVFGPRLRAAGIPVLTLGMHRPWSTVGGLVRLYRQLRGLQPDVVQTWMYHADFFGGLIARLAGIRAVSWGIRNSGADLARSSRVSRVLAALCAPLSRVVPHTVVACAHEAARRHIQWGYARDRMQVIPNGYDTALWRPDPAARRQVRADWGVLDDTVVIGCVARWNTLKDHANLIAALGQVAGSAVPWKAVLIGQDVDEDNAGLIALLQRHGVHERVRLLGRRDDVPVLMQGLDLHVLASRAEGFPNVVAEAMAAGVLCVVTDVGDAADIVAEAGWVVPPRDSHALAVGMAEALAVLGTTAAARRRAEGLSRVQARYSLEAMVGRWTQLWESVASGNRPGRSSGSSGQPLRQEPAGIGLAPAGQGDGSKAQQALRARRLLMVVNNPAFFLSHRLPVALGAQAAGDDVHIATMDGPAVARIRAHGLACHCLPLTRSGRNPLRELWALFSLWQLFRRVRPDIVHTVTIKPVLYGGIAARLAGVPALVAAVSGLGYVFTRAAGAWDPVRWLVLRLYRFSLGHRNSRVIVQNPADQAVLEQAGVIRAGQAVLIRGSGVDLDVFAATPPPAEPVVVLCAARLLAHKGIREFVEAARLSQAQGEGLRWQLAGSPDPGNPATISAQEAQQWHDEGIIEWLGERTDMASLYAQAHIAALPSYREGLPKSLIEAAACARPVVTTDVPGCRDVIEPDRSGVLVPVRDARALHQAVRALAQDAPRRLAMGQAGRALAEREFDVRQIVAQHLALYDAMGAGPAPGRG